MKTKFGNAKINANGYYVITSNKEGNHNKYLHRLIYEDFWGVTLPSEIHIHHKDGDKENNCVLNLEALLKSEHHKLLIHSKESKKKISNSLKGENNPNYNKTFKQKLSSKISNSKSKNTFGVFRVTKQPSPSCKQGFSYVYQYFDGDNKRKIISSVSLEKLKEKVLAKGLEWIEFDKEDLNGIKN